MNIELPRKVLGLCVASLLLSACGGGSGGGMVRTPAQAAPPAPPPAPPPPPGPSTNPTLCPSPPTSHCVVTLANGARENLPAVQSSHALIVQAGTGRLGLVEGAYRFDGGTRVEMGQLGVGIGTNYSTDQTQLESNVTVDPSGSLFVLGTIRGNVTNRGWMDLWGTVSGNVVNTGTIALIGAVYGNAMTVIGDFSSSGPGTVAFTLAPPGWDSPAPLRVSGRADLGGTLQLWRYSDDWGPYPLPATQGHHILHADGGVFGQFASWTAPGLFVEATLHYGSHDVWFDVTRVSIAAATAGNRIGGALTLASAANLDLAFARVDGFASAPTSPAQQRFLRSAAHIAWLADPGQARLSLDSLAGALHVDTLQRARAQGDATAVNARLARVQPGLAAGAWSQPGSHGASAGFDQWLGPRLLVGASTGIELADLGDPLGGTARSQAPRVDAYLRWHGERGWYVGGSTGYAQHALALDRPIDLGRGGRWNAHSQRTLDVVHAQAEAGRAMRAGAGRLAPYAGLEGSTLRSDRAIEQGSTGFELALRPATQVELAGRLGLRYARDWRIGAEGWLQLDADAHVRRRLAHGGDPLRAAFLGVPDAWFEVPGLDGAGSAALCLGLRGGRARHWHWSLDYARYLGGGTAEGSAVASLRRDF